MANSPTNLRIHVGPDGVVEFSVALTGSTDPSMVASMVAAVRAGMITTPPAKHLRPKETPTCCAPLSANAHDDAAPAVSPHPHKPQCAFLSPAQEPSSDRDAEGTRSDRPPSPSVAQPLRKLSVREIAAQLDADETRRSLHFYTTSTQEHVTQDKYDPVREFSSSPALWLTGGADRYVDSLENSFKHGEAAGPPAIENGKLLRSASAQDQEPRSLGQPPRTYRSRGTSTSPMPVSELPSTLPDRPLSKGPQDVNVGVETAPSFVAGPIRMLSLPAGSQHDDVNDMYFGDGSMGGAREVASIGSHGFRHLEADTAAILGPRSVRGNRQDEDQVLGRSFISPADRVRARRDRAANMSSAEQPQNRVTTGLAPDMNEAIALDGEQEHQVIPSHPYLQLNEQRREEEEGDAWENVEYELTDSYRESGKRAEMQGPENEHGRSHHRSVAWRLFASISNSLGKKRIDAEDDVYQSTLAPSNVVYKTEKTLGKVRGPLRRAGGYRFGRGGGPWLEFSSPVEVERMIAEVGKITEALGFQVWRRPGENKLRCVRWLNHRREMHMVITVSSIGLPHGSVSVARLKRARGDRNRTEVWRYSQVYRELIERLQRSGVEIMSEV